MNDTDAAIGAEIVSHAQSALANKLEVHLIFAHREKSLAVTNVEIRGSLAHCYSDELRTLIRLDQIVGLRSKEPWSVNDLLS